MAGTQFDAEVGDMPDDIDNDAKSDADWEFDDLDGSQQKQMLAYVMQGKPQTPQNMNAARNLLLNDPETVSELCKKLDIQPSQDDDEGDQDDGK